MHQDLLDDVGSLDEGFIASVSTEPLGLSSGRRLDEVSAERRAQVRFAAETDASMAFAATRRAGACTTVDSPT